MHHRLSPRKHRFVYDIYLFCLDLDEIPTLGRYLWFFGHNRRNLFEFRDADHLSMSGDKAKDSVISYARSKGVQDPITKVLLVTHLRTLGYIFNPVSFYFCFGPDDAPVCCVAEVMNTYREMKLFLIGRDHFDAGMFWMVRPKHFYVSPFVDLDAMFEFRVELPGDRLRIHINDLDKRGNAFLVTSLTGRKRELTNLRLLGYLFRFPLITVKLIWSIHWQALRLYVKGLPYHKKASNQHLQQEVHYARH